MLYEGIEMKIREQMNEGVLETQGKMTREMAVGCQETPSVRSREKLLGTKSCLR